MLPLTRLPRAFCGPLLRSAVAVAVAFDCLAHGSCGVGAALPAQSSAGRLNPAR